MHTGLVIQSAIMFVIVIEVTNLHGVSRNLLNVVQPHQDVTHPQ
jgi:hypothetical protein